jgi:3-oxoacyl-[acyl-carrier-protein] synthase-3
MDSIMNLKIDITGIGKSLPSNELRSSTLDKKLNFSDGTVEKITGLKKRHFFKDSEDMDNCVLKAIDEAVKMADISIDNIDCIINSSGTMIQAIPYNAAYTHKLLNTTKPIPSFDINMTCLSTLRAFDISARLFDTYKYILIVSADFTSVSLDWSDIRTAGIFGDGATAIVVSKSLTGGILFSNFETHSKGYEYCQIKAGGSKRAPKIYDGNFEDICNFQMDAKKLFKLSSQILPAFIFDTLKLNEMNINDIDYIVPHQASGASLKHIIKIMDIDHTKVIDIFSSHANQVSSSIPSALYTLIHTKNLKSGQKVMLVGTSAGLGLGLVVWEVP